MKGKEKRRRKWTLGEVRKEGRVGRGSKEFGHGREWRKSESKRESEESESDKMKEWEWEERHIGSKIIRGKEERGGKEWGEEKREESRRERQRAMDHSF